MLAFLGLSFDVRKLLGLKKQHVGLDIQQDSVTLVRVRHGKEHWEVAEFAKIPLSEGTVHDGVICHRDNLVAAIRAAVKQTNTYGYECTIGLSGYQVIVKKISLPGMTDTEFDNCIRWEAEQYIPFDIKDVHVDGQILSRGSGNNQMNVWLLAAKNDVVEGLMSVVAEAGLRPTVVTSSNSSLVNMVRLGYPNCSDEHAAVCVDVRPFSTIVGILQNGICVFSRDLNIGSDQKTEVLISEIQRSVDFFAATSFDCELSRVYLTSGSLNAEGLKNALKDRLNVQVEVIDPFIQMRVDLDLAIATQKEDIRDAVIALGLAQCTKEDVRMDGGEMRINLLRERKSLISKPKSFWHMPSLQNDIERIWQRMMRTRSAKFVLAIGFLILVFGAVTAGTIVGNLLMRP